MKNDLSKLKKMINEAVREQLENQVVEPVVEPVVEDQKIESLFGYIRQQIQDKNFTMAKRFVINLTNEIEEIEKRELGLATIDAVQAEEDDA